MFLYMLASFIAVFKHMTHAVGASFTNIAVYFNHWQSQVDGRIERRAAGLLPPPEVRVVHEPRCETDVKEDLN